MDNTRDRKNTSVSCGQDGHDLARSMESADWMEQVRNLNAEHSLSTGKVRTFRLDVFGCQMNERDAETIAGMLTNMGYEQVSHDEPADIIVFVTCCVRENAEEKIYGHIGALSHECEKHGSIIVASGCMMQQPHVAEKIKKSYRNVKIVFGTHNIHDFPMLLHRYLTKRKRVFEVWEKEGRVIEDMPIKRSHRHKAWVNIVYGCNNFCTYCIVPYVRGRERSRRREDILEEIRALASDGCREITLLGQNVNSYGNDLGEKDLFARLLYDIETVDGIDRVRFMTSHPKDLSDSLIKAMKECSKVCEHLHLPFQAGSNSVLERMNRKYTREHYLDLVERIRDAVPDIALTTDIIVGFPGENEEDFEDTLDLVRRVRFDAAYTFIYSPRKGTPAEKWEQTEPPETISKRFQRLLEIQTDISTQLAKRYEGRTVEVLVEGPSKSNPDMQSGRTRTGRLVNFKADTDLTGQMADVNIIRAGAFWLEGKEGKRRG
ncbi:MAG: tRNA (N6-isopentenyl adenosine(37)-C2)-methylthiotransferase MiaB [Bacillota bacterium]|nr:tRNA (N6-isopentenyl adenosine(37)-C2)-methylthiotransferase MiaB [Bacillota bacterium]